jgi:hypothetical protein
MKVKAASVGGLFHLACPLRRLIQKLEIDKDILADQDAAPDDIASLPSDLMFWHFHL